MLEQKVLPYILQHKKRLKIWSAACSTGEEPYTLAMILSNYIPLNKVEILATDLDEKVLQQAKNGRYLERSLKEVKEGGKREFFIHDGTYYQVKDKIKRCVTFKKHNLLSDPYEGSFDLIVCRNVLIYFKEEAKESIYKNFTSSLEHGGIFFVGSTEQIFSPQKYGLDIFDTFFYKKT